MPRPPARHEQRPGQRAGASGMHHSTPPTQRERLIDATIELAAREGLAGLSIAQITGQAGVSSATFYELFSDKEDCALAAFRTSTRCVLERMRPIEADSLESFEQWREQATAALGRMIDAVCSDTAAAWLLFVESLAGGPRVREERRAVTSVFQERAERFLFSPAPVGVTLDLPAIAMIGGIRTIVSRHLRASAEDQLPDLLEDLVGWLGSYAVPAGRLPWSTGPRARLRSGLAAAPAPSPPRRLPRGRHGLPPSVVARSHRTRIIHATAEVTLAKGYTEATIADIVAAAGVARQVFYEHFTDKQNAFLEAQQYPTQHIFECCAAAYFAPAGWPERVWSGLKALLDLVVVNPALSHLRLVECYAAGPAAIRRAEDVTRSFTIFFEEGFAVRPEATQLPRTVSQAIAGAVFEVIQRYAAAGEIELLPALLPQLAYIVIAPFTGAEQAIELLDELILAERDGRED